MNVADVEPNVHGGRRRRNLGRAAGSRWTGIQHVECDVGTLSVVPHVHSMEEEIYVVLSGSARIKLDEEIVALGQWDAIRVAATTARAIEAGSEGAEILAFGAPSNDNADAQVLPDFWRD